MKFLALSTYVFILSTSAFAVSPKPACEAKAIEAAQALNKLNGATLPAQFKVASAEFGRGALGQTLDATYVLNGMDEVVKVIILEGKDSNNGTYFCSVESIAQLSD